VPASGPGRKLSFAQHLAISIFWFATNLQWGAYLILIIPSQATRLAPLLHMTKGAVAGWTFGLGALVGALTPPIVGALSDRCTLRLGRRRPFVIVGGIINVLGLGLFYLAFRQGNLVGYVAAYLLVNLGNNIASGAFSGVIPDLVPKAERGYASGMMAFMQQSGTILGLVIGSLARTSGVSQDGLATALVAGVFAVVTLVTVACIREERLVNAPPLRLSELKDCFWVSPREHPDFAWVWVQRALFTLGWNLIQANLLFFIADVLNKRPAEPTLNVVGIIVLLAAVPTGVLCGPLSDRVGRKPIIFAAGVVMAATCVVFGSLNALPEGWRLPLLYGLGTLWGCGYGAYISVDWALGTDVLPNPDEAGKDMGVWHLSMTLPASLASPFGALLLAPFALPGGASYRPIGYTPLFLVGSTLLALCAVLIWRVKKAR
jgi:MFS family permease